MLSSRFRSRDRMGVGFGKSSRAPAANWPAETGATVLGAAGHLGYEDELAPLRPSASWPPAFRSALYRTFRTSRLLRRGRQQVPRILSICNNIVKIFKTLTNFEH